MRGNGMTMNTTSLRSLQQSVEIPAQNNIIQPGVYASGNIPSGELQVDMDLLITDRQSKIWYVWYDDELNRVQPLTKYIK
jgi:hypothetical protein